MKARISAAVVLAVALAVGGLDRVRQHRQSTRAPQQTRSSSG